MNESDLEKELRSLLPTKPSAQLAERIATELSAPAARTSEPASGLIARPAKKAVFMRPWSILLAGAAAVVIGFFAVALWLKPGSTNIASKSETATPVVALNETPDESVDELIGAQDEGLVYGEDEEPQRQVRMVYLERHTWTNPQTGAVVEFEVPREDIVLMPVAMQ
jgi:hypothetical protein